MNTTTSHTQSSASNLAPNHALGTQQMPPLHQPNRLSQVALAISIALVSQQSFAGVQTDENTHSNVSMGNFNFGIYDQSVWAPDGPSSFQVDWELTSKDWDSVFGRPPRARLGVGRVEGGCFLGTCAYFGAAAGVQLEAYMLPYLNLNLEPGTFDATAHYTPTVSYQFEGLGTDRFSLDTRSGLHQESSSFSVDAPRFELKTGLNIQTNLSLFAQACIVDCFIDEKYVIPGTTTNFDVDLLRIDTFKGEFSYLNPNLDEVSAQDIVDFIAGDANVMDAFYHQITAEDVANKVKEQADKRLSEGNATTVKNLLEIDTGPISIELSNPFTENAQGSINHGSFSASLGGDLLDVSLDIDQVIGYAFGLPNGGTLEFEEGPVTADLTIGDINAGPTVDLIQDISVTPELMVNMQFDNEIFVAGRIGKQTSYYGAWDNLPDFALLADSNILRDGEQPEDKTVNASTAFSLNATVKNRTYLDIGGQVSGELLSASIDIDDFTALEIGPLMSFEEEASLFEVDVYNNSFALNRWSSIDANGIETGVRTLQGENLSFNGFGEIVFQGRSEGDFDSGANDTYYYDDDRIDQYLTADELIRYDAGERYYNQIQDNTLKNRLYQEFTVDQYQAGQIMQDGKLTVNSNRTMTIEAEASVEMGMDNNYRVRNIFEEAEDRTELGLVNQGQLNVYGEIYSNAGIENQQYVFRNTSDAQISVGANGWLKFDGNMQNQGEIDNYGRIENTAEASWSTGKIDNKVGASFDVYGSFELINNDRISDQYSNDGTVEVYKGGELVVKSSGGQGTLNNSGTLFIEHGAELRTNNTTNSATTVINNQGLVESAGYVFNSARSTINNGTSASVSPDNITNSMVAWHASRSAIELQYNADEGYLDTNQQMESAANANRTAKLYWHDDPWSNEAAYAATSNTLNNYRKDGGTLDQAYQAVQIEVDTLKSAGFGVWENNKDALLVNEGTFNNNAVMVNNVGALFYNEGKLNNSGYLSNTGRLVSQNSSGIINKGLIENGTSSVKLANISTMVVMDHLDNTGHIINHDTMSNYGEIYHEQAIASSPLQAKITNHGLLSNVGTLHNAAQLSNEQGAQIDNFGRFENNATLNNHGFLNNGIENQGATTINDNASVIANAQLFNNTSRALEVEDIQLTKLLTKFENESARQSLNGFKGEVSDTSSNAFAIHLYEKYLVSDQAYGYGPRAGTLEDNRESIRDWVTSRGQLRQETKDACHNNMLECYKIYYGDREDVNDSVNAINYDLGDNNTGIQHYSQYADSGLEENINGAQGERGDNQNRFEWTMLMMLSAEGLSLDSVLDLEAMQNINPGQLNPQDEARLFKSNYFAYGDSDNFGSGDIIGLDALYALWIDKAFLETSGGYGRHGKSFTLNDARPNQNSASYALVSLYQGVHQSAEQIIALNETLSSLDIDLSNVTSVDATLVNNDTINNHGVINNRGSIINQTGSIINNDGAIINAAGANIDNDGMMVTDNNGVLLSSGTMTNSGTLDVKSGTIINEGSLINSGDILLSALFIDGGEQATVENALFTNNGYIENNASGLIEVGINSQQIDTLAGTANGNYFESTFENLGQLVNRGRIVVNDILFNSGIIVNLEGAKFENNGLINNARGSLVSFADSTTLDGSIINNGLISIADSELLTLTGGVMGSGTFAGDVMLSGTHINPGNSPGLMTFDGNVSALDTSWVFEIMGTERGISYDAIDITGNLTWLDLYHSFTIYSFIDFDTVMGFGFNFVNVSGDILDGDGNVITDLTSTLLTFSDNWLGRWIAGIDGWSLALEYIADEFTYDLQYPDRLGDNTSDVPAPPVWMFLFFSAAFLILRKDDPVPPRKEDLVP
ncbi:hypothetical protein [Paraglaciecola chathamensis]|uniref:Uncharacterized protein n=1 Tax=Paraglaciecola agarilytica NO2 TaxID=1125747 RepID=A0ABQ0I3P8_9ALTE|nr:hypothetical protein [Paraglaciecola agarilytica]GAC03902.1 hypothetical protein GAGA_1039 [Paraglaciecola agarilytica NO2]